MKLKEIIFGTFTIVFLAGAYLVASHIDYEVAIAEEAEREMNYSDPIPADLEQVEYEADCYEVRICTAYDWGQELIDPDGDIYSVIDPPEFYEGQLVSVMFDNKGTPLDKTDDVVVDLWEFE